MYKEVSLCIGTYNAMTKTLKELNIFQRLPNLDPEELLNKPDSDLTNDQKISIFVHGLIKETAARCVQIIASHPFHSKFHQHYTMCV